MGISMSHQRDVLKSPIISVMFLKPAYIEYTPNSVMVNLEKFDINHISHEIKTNGCLEDDVKNKIIYSLSHEDMKEYQLDKMRHIHFIDSNCNCLLKITNHSPDLISIPDKLFAIILNQSDKVYRD